MGARDGNDEVEFWRGAPAYNGCHCGSTSLSNGSFVVRGAAQLAVAAERAQQMPFVSTKADARAR